MIVETAAPQGECDDCGIESRLPRLVPWVWARIAPRVVHDEDEHRLCPRDGCMCGVLCQSCSECRLGRKLEAGDFQESLEIARVARGLEGRKYERVGDRVREKLERSKFTRVRSRRART